MRRQWLYPLLVSIAISSTVLADAAAQLTATLVASGLTRPVAFVQDPSNPRVQVIVEQGGTARVLLNGLIQATPFLTLDPLTDVNSAGERGLLGLAFAPDYAASGRVYVNFTNTSGHTVIARFQRSGSNPLVLDPASRFDLLWPGGQRFIAQPYANHNGGNLAFGPDGFLYIGMGDGGSGNDPEHRAQDPRTLLGKMLRIDVSVGGGDAEGYDVPVTNPFVGHAGVLPEIWSFGLRNPWRWSFDYPGAGSTGAMIIGDVGQNQWEEIDYEPMGAGGRNYGWANREGAHNTLGVTGRSMFPAALQDPVWEYPRADGVSVTGGRVYRGNALGTAYNGRYFFADFGSSRVWSLSLAVDDNSGEATAGGLQEHTSALGAAATNPSSFGVDAAGELYIVNYAGTVHKLVYAGATPPGACPPPDPLTAGTGVCVAGSWYSRARDSDFTNDLKPDLVFENTSGQLYAWYMNGITMASGDWLAPAQIDPNRLISGSADFSGDGKPDLLVQHNQTGAVALFLMSLIAQPGALPLTVIGEQPIPIAAGSPWRIVGSSDFNGDAHADVLWHNSGTGELYVWFMRPANGLAGYGGVNGAFSGGYLEDTAHARIVLGPSPWRVAGADDIDGDGTGDLVWQNDSTGEITVWYVDGLVAVSGAAFAPSRVNTAWQIRALGDYNSDGHTDLVWQHTGTGDLYVWFMVKHRFARGSFMTPGRVNLTWTIRAPK